MSRRFRYHLLILAFFAGIACLSIYWPLFHATTHVPGQSATDFFHFHWNYWWMRHALTTPGLQVYETNFVLFPFINNLAYHTMTPFWYPLWALLEPLIGTLGAMNVIFIVTLTLTGYIFFLLLRQEQVPPVLAVAGGLILQLTPSVMFAIMMTTLHYAAFFWLPLQILIWGRVVRHAEQRWRQSVIWALVQGVAFYGMVMTDYQYVLYSLFLLLPYGLLTLIKAKSSAQRGRLISLGIIAVVLALALVWFVGPLPYMLRFDRSSLAPPPATDTRRVPFPEGYFWRLDPYSGILTLGALVVPLVLVSIAASLTFLRQRLHDRWRWFWLGLAVLPLLLSAGASITIAGVQLPMPYQVLHELLGRIFRSPERFGTVFIIPSLIFVGRTWGPLLTKYLRWQPVAALVILLVVVESRLYEPMPIQPVPRHYDFYEMMRKEHGAPYDDYVVVEVPVAAGSGEVWVGDLKALTTQFYGITHEKRMVNGMIGRAPINNFWYLRTDDAMLSWLGQRRYLEPGMVETQLRERIFAWPIGYVVVHQDLIGREGPTTQEIIGYLNSLDDLLCPLLVEGDAVVYRTAWHPDGCPPRTPAEIEPGIYRIDMGSPGDERFIGWGWHWPESVSGLSVRWNGDQQQLIAGEAIQRPHPQADLYLDLPPAAYRLSLSAQAFNRDRQLTVRINGTVVGTVTVSAAGLATHDVSIPAEIIGNGEQLKVSLEYDGTVSAADVGISADMRQLGLMVDWIEFRRNE